MSIVSSMDGHGASAVMHGEKWGEGRPVRMTLSFHGSRWPETEIEARTNEQGTVVVRREHEGATALDFLTREQAADLHRKLGRALVEQIAEDDDATRIQHTTEDEDAPAPATVQ